MVILMTGDIVDLKDHQKQKIFALKIFFGHASVLCLEHKKMVRFFQEKSIKTAGFDI